MEKAENALDEARKKLRAQNVKKSTTLFVDLMTKLVEHVAQMVDLYQPLVETYYGSGYLFQFIKYLQTQCDTQGIKVVKDFVDYRRFKERARDIKKLMEKSNKATQANLRSM